MHRSHISYLSLICFKFEIMSTSTEIDTAITLSVSEVEKTLTEMCSPKEEISEKEKRRREAHKIMESEEFKAIQSPTKRVLHYILVQPERNYPKVARHTLCDDFDADYSKLYRKKRKVENGFPYEMDTKCPLFTEEEGNELLEFIKVHAERRTCASLTMVVIKATELVKHRKIELAFGFQLNRYSVEHWCSEHGIDFALPMTKYDVHALSDRESIRKMFENIHYLMALYNYPDILIINMDESWVATEKKTSKEKVAFPKGMHPITIEHADGSHVTLIGCITKSRDVVTPSYILPTELTSYKKIQEHGLQNLVHWVNKSGFMTGEIFAQWIDIVLGPWVEERRQFPGQHALLICDAHVSRMNENAREALRRNHIDMLVLPAHVTSKHQPLDVGVFSSFKENYRKFSKDVEGGLYGKLEAAGDAFRVATRSMNIKNGWEKSQLFSDDYQNVIAEYQPRQPGAKVYKNANYYVPCEDVVPV